MATRRRPRPSRRAHRIALASFRSTGHTAPLGGGPVIVPPVAAPLTLDNAAVTLDDTTITLDALTYTP